MPHLPMLDGFRAFAILIVMLSHAGLGKIVPGGFGVTIFFFLSGYLITSLLRIEAATNGRVDLYEFYLKRSLRIFPPLYLTLLLLVMLWLMGWLPGHVEGRAIAFDMLFLSNYAHLFGAGEGLPVPLWSLNVEEHFYIIFSTLFASVMVRLEPRRAAFWCAIICGVVLLVRIGNVIVLDSYYRNYYWTHTRIDSILFGCCLALWNNPIADREPWRPNSLHLGLAMLVLILCFVVRDPIFRETLRYTLQGAALFVVFSFALQNDGWIARTLSSTPLRIVGLLSYTLYLIHVPVISFIEHYLTDLKNYIQFFLIFVISFIYAGLMYIVVERPAARYRRTLSQVRRGEGRLRQPG